MQSEARRRTMPVSRRQRQHDFGNLNRMRFSKSTLQERHIIALDDGIRLGSAPEITGREPGDNGRNRSIVSMTLRKRRRSQ